MAVRQKSRSTRVARATLLAGLAAAGTLLLPGVAEQAQAEPPVPEGHLVLSVARASGFGAAPSQAVLTCGPDGGTHPRAAEACGQLRQAGGDLGALPPRSAMCPRIWAPITARAAGTWQGRQVDYRQTFGNRCEMAARTGAVFAFVSRG